MDARGLLDIAAEYVRAKDSAELARAHGTAPIADLDEIADRFEAELRGFIASAR